MRHGRAKAARKTLQFFKLSVGITPPYQIILDGTFLVAAQKIPLKERLDRLLQHEPYKLHVTRSTLLELETLSKQSTLKQQLFQQARQWGLDHADHIVEPAEIPVTASQDEHLGPAGAQLLALVRVKPLYMVCCQDDVLLDKLRHTGNTPLVRLSRGVLLLEQPSKTCHAKASAHERNKWSVVQIPQEQALLKQAKQEQQQQPSKRLDHARRGRKKAKGPNPLSCKKKRPITPATEQANRRRTRRKVSLETT
jgi:U3 small nucleolar RNA-associated protein 23